VLTKNEIMGIPFMWCTAHWLPHYVDNFETVQLKNSLDDSESFLILSLKR
jgi:hypothetical protein